jgi:hypothetical protein
MKKPIDNNDDRAHLLELLEQVEKRFESLREADREAVRLAHSDLSRRLEGFPQQFATKTEMEEAARGVQRLEKDSLSREMYDQQHRSLADVVAKLDRDKMQESVFETFLENYRIETERAATDRRSVAEVLARATETVRAQVLEERGEYLTQEYYDHEHQALERELNGVQRWQYMIVGGLVFATFVAPLVTGAIVYVLFGR